jgi:hypothetical protein
VKWWCDLLQDHGLNQHKGERSRYGWRNVGKSLVSPCSRPQVQNTSILRTLRTEIWQENEGRQTRGDTSVMCNPLFSEKKNIPVCEKCGIQSVTPNIGSVWTNRSSFGLRFGLPCRIETEVQTEPRPYQCVKEKPKKSSSLNLWLVISTVFHSL